MRYICGQRHRDLIAIPLGHNIFLRCLFYMLDSTSADVVYSSKIVKEMIPDDAYLYRPLQCYNSIAEECSYLGTGTLLQRSVPGSVQPNAIARPRS